VTALSRNDSSSFVSARPDVWRGTELASTSVAPLPTGHAALDAQLPGGGWPGAGLVELLHTQAVCHEWRLLLPALAALARERSGPVVLVGSPQGLMPFAPSLGAQGLSPDRLLWVQSPADAARLWATAQSLRCADVIAVLAWLPKVRPDALRRLHLVAIENAKPVFLLRAATASDQSSAAPLRLLLEGGEAMRVHVLKRRGPPLEQPVVLPAEGPRLAALLATKRGTAARMLAQQRDERLRQGRHVPGASDAMDRTVAA